MNYPWHPFRNDHTRPWGVMGVVALALTALVIGGLIGLRTEMSIYLMGLFGVVGYALLCAYRPFVAFQIVVFSALTVLLSGLKPVGGISVMIGLGLIFTAFWVTRFFLRTTLFTITREYYLLLALVAVMLITSLVHVGGPAGFSAAFTYVQLFLFFVLVVNLTMTPLRLHALTGVIIFSSTLLATFILLDHFGWLPSELIPEQTMGLAEGSNIMVSRTAGLWGDANFTALQLTIALPFIMGWWPEAGRIKQVLLVVASGAILVAFTWTFSIGGLLGLSVMLLIKMINTQRRDRLFAIARNVLLGIIALSSFSLIAPNIYIERVTVKLQLIINALTTLDQASLLTVGTNRGDTWWAAIQAIAASPLFGYGPGNAVYANATYSVLRIQAWLSPHNMFLAVAGDLGLIGLALFVALFISALKSVRPPSDALASNLQRDRQAIFIALCGFAAQGMALEIHNLKLLWILMGMAIAYRQMSVHLPHHPHLMMNYNRGTQ